MRTRTTILAFIMLALLATSPILQACHSTPRAGWYISETR